MTGSLGDELLRDETQETNSYTNIYEYRSI